MSDGWGQTENSTQDEEGWKDYGKRRFSELGAVLSDPYCHLVLFYLASCADEPVTVEELARHLAGSETGYHPATLIKTEYEDIQTALQRIHLPRLHKLNLINFNPRQGTVQAQQPSWEFLLLNMVGKLLNMVGKFLNWIR